MCVCPELLETSNFPADAKTKARKILSHAKGYSMGKTLTILHMDTCCAFSTIGLFQKKSSAPPPPPLTGGVVF